MTPLEEQSQTIDLQQERLNRIERKQEEITTTLIFAMRMMTNLMERLESEQDEIKF
jgi:hypothetical protein